MSELIDLSKTIESVTKDFSILTKKLFVFSILILVFLGQIATQFADKTTSITIIALAVVITAFSISVYTDAKKKQKDEMETLQNIQSRIEIIQEVRVKIDEPINKLQKYLDNNPVDNDIKAQIESTFTSIQAILKVLSKDYDSTRDREMIYNLFFNPQNSK